MTSLRLSETDQAKALIESAIAENGAMRVLLAAAKAVLRERPERRTRPPDTMRLPEHLRKDVGLYPLAQAPREYIWRFYQ